MSGARAWWLALVLAAGFTWGVLHMLGVEYAAGEIYPEYSSLRSDPLGSKLLFDSLSGMTGITTARSYLSPGYLAEKGATVLVLGTPQASIDTRDGLQPIEKIASGGNRVVIALAPQKTPFVRTGPSALIHSWHVRVATDPVASHPHPLYFAEAKDWKVLDRTGDKLLEIERNFGKGSVVLFAESDAFGNQALMASRDPRQIAEALGTSRRVLFEETHLGIAESGSVMGLARRYRLMGFVLGLAICAVLALWRNASPFPARAASTEPERMAGRTSFAGLVTLLRHHVPVQDLAATCWQEWLKTNRHQISPERARRGAAIASGTSDRPLEAVREIQTVVHVKGEL